MTTYRRLELTCPCCGAKFESTTFNTTNTFGPISTEFQQFAVGASPLPLVMHACDACGYAGYETAFEAGMVDDELRTWVGRELTPRLAPGGRLGAGERYAHAAMIAGQRGEGPEAVAGLYLAAAWCGGPGATDHRREAARWYERAFAEESLPADRQAITAYLIGEIHRRIGNRAESAAWLGRVPAIAGNRPELAGLVRLARRQLDEPGDYITPPADR
ncbi:MAG: DUF2225 domain-containing protein [bacterium]